MKPPLRCLIVDDERPALKLLRAYIDQLPQLELVAACENGAQAITALHQQEVDLLFLDIQMPDLTGLDLLRSIKVQPQVILTTAYREFAVEGFELEVTDYLVKPFSLARFAKAVAKAEKQITEAQQSAPSAPPKTVLTDEHFYVKSNHKIEKVLFKDILFLESQREYVRIHTVQRRFLVHQTMNKMELELPTHWFRRVHRSYIVGMQHVRHINGNRIIIGEHEIPIGGNYRKSFFEELRLL